MWLLVVLVAVAIFLAIHLIWYIHPSEVKSFDELQRLVSSGQPAVVEFYSNL